MNENQENQHFEEDENEEQKEPLTKRIAKFSAFIYLGLAIMVVIVATVGIFSISYDYEEEMPSVSFPELNYNAETSSIPQISIPSIDRSESTSKESEKPVLDEESGIDAELVDPNDPQSPKVMFYRPVEGEIIKSHNMDRLVFSETMKDYRVHSGIDIASEAGAPVVSFADGVVASIEDDYFFGTTVSISHAEGIVSYYMNLSPSLAENIAVGSEVLAGQPIGIVGDTARIESADQPHLHFEMTLNGELIDPETELPK